MMNVIIHSVLCIYCTVCKKVIQECINPIAAGNFKWIYAVTGHGVYSNHEFVQKQEPKLTLLSRPPKHDMLFVIRSNCSAPHSYAWEIKNNCGKPEQH